MFCLRCGSELPARATICATCGQAVFEGGAPGTSGGWRYSDALGTTLASSPAASGTFESPVAAPMGNAGRWATLWADRTGIATSHVDLALLGVLAVLALDLLLPVPWLVFGGVGFSARYLLGPLDVLPLLFCALAAAPLVYPRARSVLLLRLMPWALGTTLTGATLAVVLLLLRLHGVLANLGFIFQPTGTDGRASDGWAPFASSPTAAPWLASLSVGLIIAILCGLALIILGYLLLRATPMPTSTAPHAAVSIPPISPDEGVGG